MDLKVFILLLVTSNLMLGLAMISFQYENKAASGWNNLVFAKIFQATAWLLLYFSDMLPPIVAAPIANSILFAGFAFEAGAMWESVDRLNWRRIIFPIMMMFIAAFFIVYLLSNQAWLRITISSLAIGTLSFFGSISLLRGWRTNTILHRLIPLTAILCACLIASRGIWTMLQEIGSSPISSLFLLTVSFISLHVLMLVNGFGFLLLLQQKQSDALTRLSLTDPLTGAPNRRGFFNAMSPWMSLARRPGPPTALIVLDLDDLKRINDDYGHAIGDGVLKTVVAIGQKQLRDSDLIGHLSSQDFAVMLPRTSMEEALVVAERMRQAIQDAPIKTERAIISVTASLGVTIILADDSMATLFKRADDALQHAKNLGRNLVAEAQINTLTVK